MSRWRVEFLHFENVAVGVDRNKKIIGKSPCQPSTLVTLVDSVPLSMLVGFASFTYPNGVFDN